jgi:dienelactone hydrolase
MLHIEDDYLGPLEVGIAVTFKIGQSLVVALLLSMAAWGESAQPAGPEIVVIPSGRLRLKGFLWRPAGPGPFPAVLFNHGSGGADAAHTAGMTMTEAAERLGRLFVKHGYAFFYPCRRGQGLSADQSPFMLDLLQKEEAAKGEDARLRLQLIFTTMDHLDDEMAALAFLKSAPGIDVHRIAVAGHSFGGKLTLLEVERDADLRAAVAFAAAAESWDRSPELRERLLTAVRQTDAPVMLIHAENDFGTSAGRDLAAELERRHKPHVLKIYPPVGETKDDGHNLLYLGVPLWEADVFGFLDQYVKGAEAQHLSPAVTEATPNASFGSDAPATREDIQRLFGAMHVPDQIRTSMEVMLTQQRRSVAEMMKKRNRRVTEEDIDRASETAQEFLKNFPLDELVEEMIPVYQKHLTKVDVDAMAAFYSSPTGQKLLREQPAMAGESMQAVAARVQKALDLAIDHADQKAQEDADREKAPAEIPGQRKN